MITNYTKEYGKETTQKSGLIIPRPPVIAIMGHIDHGKSTLLSYIRKSTKALSEAGGITQHISAYEIDHVASDGKTHLITFLDTPGHEAFSGIRTRGAQVADIAILVVSAEDGVKPQTLEAWRTITESKTPFIVAINKIDKEAANIERTKNNLTENGIYIEGYGGDTPALPISAKTGSGIPELLDMIILMADLESLTGDPSLPGEGIVIESNRHEQKGISATCIIKNGTVRSGMFAFSGTSTTPVRIMENYRGQHIQTATFSSPVTLIGWDSLPEVGSTFKTFNTREEVKIALEKARENTQNNTVNLHDYSENNKDDHTRLPIIIKADAGGSLEAVVTEIQKLQTDRISAQIIFRGIGTISENDVRQASGTTKALIIGFHTDIDAPAVRLAERNEIEIKTFDVIYKMTEWLQEKLVAHTPKQNIEESVGIAKIIKIFSKVKDKQILGAKVEKGQITLGSEVKIMRRDTVVGSGKIKELQEQKKKVTDVPEGHEFGTLIEAKIEIAIGDRIESFIIIEK